MKTRLSQICNPSDCDGFSVATALRHPLPRPAWTSAAAAPSRPLRVALSLSLFSNFLLTPGCRLFYFPKAEDSRPPSLVLQSEERPCVLLQVSTVATDCQPRPTLPLLTRHGPLTPASKPAFPPGTRHHPGLLMSLFICFVSTVKGLPFSFHTTESECFPAPSKRHPSHVPAPCDRKSGSHSSARPPAFSL